MSIIFMGVTNFNINILETFQNMMSNTVMKIHKNVHEIIVKNAKHFWATMEVLFLPKSS